MVGTWRYGPKQEDLWARDGFPYEVWNNPDFARAPVPRKYTEAGKKRAQERDKAQAAKKQEERDRKKVDQQRSKVRHYRSGQGTITTSRLTQRKVVRKPNNVERASDRPKSQTTQHSPDRDGHSPSNDSSSTSDDNQSPSTKPQPRLNLRRPLGELPSAGNHGSQKGDQSDQEGSQTTKRSRNESPIDDTAMNRSPPKPQPKLDLRRPLGGRPSGGKNGSNKSGPSEQKGSQATKQLQKENPFNDATVNRPPSNPQPKLDLRRAFGERPSGGNNGSNKSDRSDGEESQEAKRVREANGKTHPKDVAHKRQLTMTLEVQRATDVRRTSREHDTVENDGGSNRDGQSEQGVGQGEIRRSVRLQGRLSVTSTAMGSVMDPNASSGSEYEDNSDVDEEDDDSALEDDDDDDDFASEEDDNSDDDFSSGYDDDDEDSFISEDVDDEDDGSDSENVDSDDDDFTPEDVDDNEDKVASEGIDNAAFDGTETAEYVQTGAKRRRLLSPSDPVDQILVQREPEDKDVDQAPMQLREDGSF